MKNRLFIVLIVIIVITGCLFFVSCKDDDDNNSVVNNNNTGGGTNTNGGTPGLSKEIPPANVLDTFGITETQFTAIRNAGGTEKFMGWIYFERNIEGMGHTKIINIMWSERIKNDFDAVLNYLETNISSKSVENETNELIVAMGATGDWSLVLYLSDTPAEYGVYLAGTLILAFIK